MKSYVYRSNLYEKKNNTHLITFEDGCDYVLKLYKENEDKALVNEWFSYCIARYMQLPISPSYLLELPEAMIDSIPFAEQFRKTSKYFVSKYISDSVNGHEAHVTNIINRNDLAGIIVFDYWLYNTDRTKKNILLQEKEPGSYFLWIIDQAEMFGSLSWTVNDLQYVPQKLMKSATHKMMAKFIPHETDLKKQVELIQTIPTQLLEEILAFVPDELRLSSEEQQEMIKVLNYRRNHILPGLIRKFIKKVYRPLHASNIQS